MTPYTSTTIYLGPDARTAPTPWPTTSTMTIRLANAKTGLPVASALDGFADHVCDPAFSPDGKHLAFSSNVTGSLPRGVHARATST